MLSNEQRAHDLAVLYMQLEIKEERIIIAITDDSEGFLNEYKHQYAIFLDLLENP